MTFVLCFVVTQGSRRAHPQELILLESVVLKSLPSSSQLGFETGCILLIGDGSDQPSHSVLQYDHGVIGGGRRAGGVVVLLAGDLCASAAVMPAMEGCLVQLVHQIYSLVNRRCQVCFEKK